MTKKSVEIKLQNGLEARPVAVLVQVASKYDSRIYLESNGKKVNAKSIIDTVINIGPKSPRVILSDC